MLRQPAVIFDRDGTLFSVKHHMQSEELGPWDWGSYNGLCAFDAPIPLVAALFRSIRPGVIKIITSGRMDHTRRDMLYAMRKHDLVPDLLFMRRTGDHRRDTIVKREIYETLIEPRFDVRYVIDDRPSVVQGWRDLGLPVMQVKDPGIMPRIVTCPRTNGRSYSTGLREFNFPFTFDEETSCSTSNI